MFCLKSFGWGLTITMALVHLSLAGNTTTMCEVAVGSKNPETLNGVSFTPSERGAILTAYEYAPRLRPMIIVHLDSALSPIFSVEDVIQECMRKFISNIAQFDSAKGEVTTYFKKIVKNHLLDLRRKKRLKIIRRIVDLEDPSISILENLSDPNAKDPSERLSKEETLTLLNKALLMLPKDFRRILQLKYLEGLTHQEIAEIIQIHKGTVKSRVYRATENLRKILAKISVH